MHHSAPILTAENAVAENLRLSLKLFNTYHKQTLMGNGKWSHLSAELHYFKLTMDIFLKDIGCKVPF